jgi:hypothetical protein
LTTWYRTGTIGATNGSPTITGTLTAWAAQAKAGDELVDIAAGVSYEIAAVASDTSLTIVGNYAGSTGTGKAYAIKRIAGAWHTVSDLALSLADLTEAVKLGFRATSATSLAIGTGSKTFTVQSGIPILAGAFMTATSAANVTNRMGGQVTSYSDTTLVMNVTATNGTGTYADWNLNIGGPPGAAGSQGIQGIQGSQGIAGPTTPVAVLNNISEYPGSPTTGTFYVVKA